MTIQFELLVDFPSPVLILISPLDNTDRSLSYKVPMPWNNVESSNNCKFIISVINKQF